MKASSPSTCGALGCRCFVAAALLTASVVGCSHGARNEGHPRALLIGVDGASNRIIQPMMERGELPHFAEIARTGTRGVLRPTYPLLSPRIWTSVATGKKPERHGIKHWVWMDAEGRPRLYMSTDRKVHALWNILSDAGLSVGVVNWLVTNPPERIKGVMISAHAVPGFTERAIQLAEGFARDLPGRRGNVIAPKVAAAAAFPAPWAERAVSLHRKRQPDLTEIGNPFMGPGWPDIPFARNMREVYRNDELITGMALAVDEEIRPYLLMVYLPGIDRVSHFIWDGVEPSEAIPPERRLPPNVLTKHGKALRAYYRFVDALIGRLMADRGEDDLVMVLSDHGFEVGTEPGQMPGVHDSERARDGVLYVRGRGIPPGLRGVVLDVNDVTPTLLAWLGLGHAEDMDGTPAEFLEFEIHQPVATYETTPIERVGEPLSGAEEVIIDQLRELGYVE